MGYGLSLRTSQRLKRLARLRAHFRVAERLLQRTLCPLPFRHFRAGYAAFLALRRLLLDVSRGNFAHFGVLVRWRSNRCL